MTTTHDGDAHTLDGNPARTDDGAIRINTDVNPRVMILPAVGAAVGMSVGFVRGSREAGLQFLAENAHQQPKTVRGWYFYNKTKNYRMIWAGLKSGGKNAVKIGSVGLLWAGIEEGVSRYGTPLEPFKETVAGLGTAIAFSAVNRMGGPAGWRTVILGTVVGGVMSALRMGQERIGTRIQEEKGSKGATVGD